MFLLLFVAASLGGIYDPFDRFHSGELWPGVLFVAVAMMLARRASPLVWSLTETR
jgi:hypothetical protein